MGILPEHLWQGISDDDFAQSTLNTSPVGSGPFTTIARFTGQDYVLSKNPHYWQAGKPLIPCLKYVQAASNAAALALIQTLVVAIAMIVLVAVTRRVGAHPVD